ncbi:MAG: hypothetical protein AAGD01_11560 [Acidobacteriota bacterium]
MTMQYTAEDFETPKSKAGGTEIGLRTALYIVAALGLGVYAYWEILQGAALTTWAYVLGGLLWGLLVCVAAFSLRWSAATIRDLTIVWTLLFLLHAIPWTPVKTFQARFAKIKVGMTYEQVDRTMYPYEPRGYHSDTASQWSYLPAPDAKKYWDHSATISFKEGKVVRKVYRESY